MNMKKTGQSKGHAAKMAAVAFAIGGVFCGGAVQAAVTGAGWASDTANASATIVTPITITKSTDLSFGRIALANGAGGTVTISTAGAKSSTNGLTSLDTVTAAQFAVTGDLNATYDIVIPTPVVTLSSGSDTMSLALSHDAAAGTLGTLSAAGAQTLRFGGVLTVGASQAPGNYTGTFDVNVNYN